MGEDGAGARAGVTADFKKGPRIVNPGVTQEVVRLYPFCAACGERAETGDHVIRRGQLGDDVIANVVSLCGHGTARCHGAKHGTPYTVPEGKRDAEWVAWRVGDSLLRERHDVLAYVLEKLGREPGLDFLSRRYRLRPSDVLATIEKAH